MTRKTVVSVSVLVVSLCLLVMTFSSWAANTVTEWPIRLAWDANTESDLAGYRMYYASVSFAGVVPYGAYIAEIPAGTETLDYTISAEGFHYFLVTAFDTIGNESDASNEVMYAADATPPGACTGLTVTKQ